MEKKVSRWRSRFLAAVIGIVFGVALCEVVLRVAGYSYPEFYAADEKLGYSLIPGMTGWYQKEGRAYVAINSDSLRDEEHEVVKPENTFRIAVLGDSYAEAFQVEMKEAFWKVMESRLAGCGSVRANRVEVLNFGASGYGTAQELIVLRERVWKYQPDLVLLAVTTNNDITDNSKVLKKAPIPYFDLRDGQLELDDSFRENSTFNLRSSAIGRAGTWLSNNLRTIQAIRRTWVNIRHIINARGERPSKNSDAEISAPSTQADQPIAASDVGIDHAVYLEPKDPKWISAWQVSEALIEQMHREVGAKGSRFLVVTLSNGIQVWPDRKARDGFARRIGSSDLLYPDKRIEKFCESKGINATMLAPGLVDYAETNRTYLHGFDKNIGNGHWNTEGHRIAGEILADEICTSDILLETPLP